MWLLILVRPGQAQTEAEKGAKEGTTKLEDWILSYVANPSLRQNYTKRLQVSLQTS